MPAINAPPPMSSYRKRFISCSGTYYIDGTKSTSKWHYSFILLFLIFLLCFIVAVGCLIATLSSGTSVIEEFQNNCKNETSVTHKQLLSYERYFNSFKGKGFDQICNRVTCFIKNNGTVSLVNRLYPDARVLGETVFSDWCLEPRKQYPGKLSVTPVRINLPSNNTVRSHVPDYDKFVHLVGYNESASLPDKLVSGVLQWRHYFETNDDKVFYGTPEYYKAMNVTLAEILFISADSDGVHKTYLMENKVFATELRLPDHVYFFNSSGILTDKGCNSLSGKSTEVAIYAIVLGFDNQQRDNTTEFHWIVQPVGQKWKQTSPGGIMKLTDRCHKGSNYPRLFDVIKQAETDLPLGSLEKPSSPSA